MPIGSGLFQLMAAEVLVSNYRRDNRAKRIESKWHRMFEENIRGEHIGLSRQKLKDLAHRPAVKRYFYKTFEPMEGIVTTRDMSLAIGVELYDKNMNIKPYDVRQFSKAIRKEWIKILIATETAKNAMNVLDKKVKDHIEDNHDKDEIEETLGDRTKLREAYFKTYEEEEEEDIINIRYGKNVFKSDYNIKDLKVSIKTNKFTGFELGFYRKGYEYALVTDDRYLNLYSMNVKSTKEYLHFK